MSKSHTYLLARIERIERIDAASVVILATVDPTTPDEAWTKLKESVTDWILETKAGWEAWHESVEDFNIGDASMCGMEDDPDFKAIALRHQLTMVIIQPLSWDVRRPFDEVLGDRSKLPEEDAWNPGLVGA